MTSEQYDADTELMPSWADLFPFLARTPGEWTQWMSEPLDVDSRMAPAIVKSAAENAIDSFPDIPFERVFPAIATRVDEIPWDLMDTRATNALRRLGVTTILGLTQRCARDLGDIRNVGRGSVLTIVEALATTSIELMRETSGSWVRETAPSTSFVFSPVKEVRSPSSRDTDLRTIAEWHCLRGEPDANVLGMKGLEGSPSQVQEAFDRLKGLCARDLVNPSEFAPALILDGFIASLEPRALEVVRRRLFADSPDTLDAIGQDLGITRERVRQIANLAATSMTGNLLSSSTGIDDLARAVCNRIGKMSSIENLLTTFPGLRDEVKAVRQPAWRVLDRLDNAFEVESGWAAVPTVAHAREMTIAAAAELADSLGLVPVTEIADVLGFDLSIRGQEFENWISFVGLATFRGQVVATARSIPDWAAIVLGAEGRPLALQEVLDLLPTERAASSVRNALAEDNRFVRVDRDAWALADWGFEAYTGIRDMIGKAVDDHGGSAEIESVVERLTAKYSVSASSIRAYASSPPFDTTGGMIRRSTGPQRAYMTPGRTRRLFRQKEEWRLRFRVVPEHMRGSGYAIGTGVAGALALEPGESRSLPCPSGAQSIYWTGIQPSLGSIRRFLDAAAIPPGAEVFARFGDDGTFDLEVLPDTSGLIGIDLALALIGATPTDHSDARRQLAVALCLDSEAPWSSIVGAARDRGDNDIAEALLATELPDAGTEMPMVSAPLDDAVDEILRLL